METFSVTVDEDGHAATYQPPQLVGVSVQANVLRLEFDPMHSGETSAEYAVDNIISLAARV